MQTTNKREDLVRSALLMTGATYINYGTGMLISLVIARSLGPTHYGQYAYLIWLSGILVALCNHGLPTTAITHVSERLGSSDATGAAAVYGWLKRQRKYSVFVVCALFLVALPLIKPAGWQDHLLLFVVLVLASAISKSSYVMGVSIAKGYGRFSIEAIISNSLSVLSLLCVLGVALLGGELVHYAAVFVAVSISHAILSFALLRKAGLRASESALAPDLLSRIKKHLYWTTLLMFIAVFSSKTIETFLLNSLVSADAVGFFLIAVALTKGGIELLSSGLNSVLMSHMAHAYGADGESAVNRVLCDNVRYFHFLGLLVAGVGYFWAAPMIQLLYGEKYLPSVLVLQIMVVVGGLALTDGVFGARLSTTGSQKTRTLIVFSTMVISAIAALLLVPRYGLIGAAASSALSVLLGVVTSAAYTSVRSKVQLPYRALLKITLIAIGAAALATCIRWISSAIAMQLAAGLVFAVIYLFASLWLRSWTTTDLRGASDILRRVPGCKNHRIRLERWGRPS